MTGTRLRHFAKPRHRDGTISIKVYPTDGRYPEEFRVKPAELRRFAWAALADLAPAEAEIARTEESAELFAFELNANAKTVVKLRA